MAALWRAIIVIILTSNVRCAKILGFFPTPAISHQVVFRPLMHELAKRGHEVVVVTPNPAFPKGQTPANLTEIDVHDESYAHWEEILKIHDGKKGTIIQQLVHLLNKFTTVFDLQLNLPEVKKMMTEEKDSFDLIIAEAAVRITAGLGHYFKKPIIHFSSLGSFPNHYGFFGAPSNPLVFPSPVSQRLHNLTFTEKLWEIFTHLVTEYLITITGDFDDAVARRNFGEDMPPLEEVLVKYVQMLFLNEHPIWAHNHPVPPNIVYVGGIHQAPDTDLPKDLQDYLDKSEYGVIYISFGTSVNINQLPPGKVEMMINVLSKLPYDVIWKWDADEIPEKPSNIKLVKWVPQAQLLKHPKMKLFITQGGLQSTDEMIDAAVPGIGIPMLGDQWYNTEKYQHHGVGLQLHIHHLTEEQFTHAVTSVIQNKSYKQNMLKLRRLMRSYPVKPVDLAVWWTEHILEHGGSHLRSPAFNMPFYKYYEVPLVLTILSVLLVILVASFFIVRLIVRYIMYKLRYLQTKIKKT